MLYIVLIILDECLSVYYDCLVCK